MFVRKIKAQSRPLLHSIFCLFKQSNTFTSNKREDLSTQILLPGFKLTTSWVSLCCRRLLFFKKWANPGLFFIYFRLFKGTLQILQQIGMRKYPIYNAGIRSLVNLNSLLHQWDYLGAEGPKDVLFNRKMPLWVIQERGLGDGQTGIIFNLTLASCSLESNNIQSFITCPRVGNWTPIVSWPRSRVVNFLSSGWKINEVSWERIFIYHWTKLVIE